MNWNGNFTLRCYNKLTGFKWSDQIKNGLTNQGEENILDSYLRDNNSPAEFYIGLTSMISLGEDTTLLTLTNEVSASDYTRQLLERSVAGWPQLALDPGDSNYQVVSKVASFEATSTWTLVNKLFLCTTIDNSGILISYGNLSTDRTLVENDILDITYKIKLA